MPMLGEEVIDNQSIDMLGTDTQAQKVGAYEILGGKAIESSGFTTGFRRCDRHIFPAERCLVRNPEFSRARHARKCNSPSAGSAKIVAHVAMPVDEPVNVPKVNPGHGARKSSQVDPCEAGFSLGSASNAISISYRSHTFRRSIRLGAGIRPSSTN